MGTGGSTTQPTSVRTELDGGSSGSGGTTGWWWNWQDGGLTVPVNTAVTDTATLRGPNVSGAGGTVTYAVFSDSACTVSAGSGEHVTVTAGNVPASTPVSLASPGTYYWQASYSGDPANAASKSTCGSEVETVKAPRPGAHPPHHGARGWNDREAGWSNADILTVTAGTAVTDSATLTGANTSSGREVTYTVYQDPMCWRGGGHDSNCTPQQVGTDTETVTDGIVPNSKPITLGAGFYSLGSDVLR